MTKSISISPGKVILFGEHFVVRGSKALVAAIDLYAKAEIEESSWPSEIISEGTEIRGKITADLKVIGSKELEPFAKILSVLKSWGFQLSGFKARISSEIPMSAGLGSSAASAAAFSLSYTNMLGYKLNDKELFTLSNEAEKVTHGNPSGVDSAAVTYGGILIFKKDVGIISKLNTLFSDKYSLIIADSGIKRSTSVPVRDVLILSEKLWPAISLIYDAADKIIDLGNEAISNGDYETLGTLMNINQGLLNSIGVSSIELEEIIYRSRLAGAIGAKLTGAGRGGSVIILAPSNKIENIIDRVKCCVKWASRIKISQSGARLISS
ncbi:mevalonate kinase [Caldisphaera sp.]|uniref:mevalonate kinase n=1 Tax=Caldisphaera sp. TaxID=2060322 RepID=UPI0025BF96EE|nr:mevalonate kinase [Caldisphaera sp.]